jgi:MoxR-like ATPase
MTISCKSCPSYKTSSEMFRDFGMSLGCDFCPTKGKVLEGPQFTDAENQNLRENIAANCDCYGDLPPTKDTMKIDARLGLGDPQVAVHLNSRAGTIAPSEKPVTCTSCSWFVPADVVEQELGFTAPFCSAKGRLLFPSKLVKEAANCGSGINGANATTTSGMMIESQYKRTIASVTTPMQLPLTHVDLVAQDERHSVDPRDYQTDRPVTPDDEAQYIKAWRRVDDPEGLREPIYMPIFWGEKLCEEYYGPGFDPRSTYGEHRPDLYVDHHGLLYDLACELLNGETPLLIGGAGTGKSETGPWLAWLMDVPHDRIDIKKGYEASHLTGLDRLQTDPASGTPITKFVRSRFARTYDKPGITTVNEPNLSSECFEVFRPIFDNAKQFGMDEDSGMPPIERNSNRFILCTQNPSWDPMYVGAEPMSAADIDRISPIWFDLPSEEVERFIITKHCNDAGYDISSETLDKIMKVAKDLREQKETLGIAWGLRAQIKVAKKTRFYSFEKAYRRAIVDGMEPEVAEVIMLSVKSVA